MGRNGNGEVSDAWISRVLLLGLYGIEIISNVRVKNLVDSMDFLSAEGLGSGKLGRGIALLTPRLCAGSASWIQR